MEHKTSDKTFTRVISDNNLDEQCGCYVNYGCCGNIKSRYSIKCLQRFATPKWALVLLSFLGFLQGFVISGLVNVVITTIEKRFGLSSADSGLIVSSYNIASCLAIPFITYVGGRRIKPLWIGWGMGLVGLGCIVFSLPHFQSETYQINVTSGAKAHAMCDFNNTNAEPSANFGYYKYIFILAQILNGIGTSALYTLGMTYLDENVSQKQSSLYHGVYFSIAVALGPASGYMLGGVTLKVFTEIGQTPGVIPTNDAWIGAWWLGFLISGILLIILCVPTLMLPKYMPGTRELRVNRSKEMHCDRMAESLDDDKKFGTRLKDVPKSILVLLRNPAFVFVATANAIDFGLTAAFSAFTPKFLESMYGLTATNAAFYLGLAVIAGGAMGNIVGGLIVSKMNLNVRGMIRMCIISTIGGLSLSFIYFLKCTDLGFAGATQPYANTTGVSSTDFSSDCNLHCECGSDVFSPVCGDDGITYFSPCYAGCSVLENRTFTNCTCIGMSTSAVVGKCEKENCESLVLFLIALFFLFYFTVLCWTPALQIVVRVVPFHQRSFAVGVQWVFNRCFGGIPIPIVFGQVLDLACAVWSGGNGNRGSCRMYFNYDLARYSFFLVLSHKIATLCFYTLSGFLYKPPAEKTEQKPANVNSESAGYQA